MRFPFTASERSIALLFNGRMHNVPNTHPFFDKLAEALKQDKHDPDAIRQLVDQPSVLAELTEGSVSVIGNSVYFKGEALHSALTTKVVNLIAAGFDAKPWARFLDRLMTNPSENSRKCLYDFLQTFDAPITEDGCFVAFKRVRGDYMDKYTGTFDNSPGKTVTMPREQVVEDPSQPCSAGLHACSIAYLDHAYCRGSDMRTVAVKIAPEDVVSVPADYGFSKLRCCRYAVLGDIDEAGITPDEMVEKRVIGRKTFASGGTVEGPGDNPVVGVQSNRDEFGTKPASADVMTSEDDCDFCGESIAENDCECDDPDTCVWCDDFPCICDDECDGCGLDIDDCECEDEFGVGEATEFEPTTMVKVGDGLVTKDEFREAFDLCDNVADLANFYDITEAEAFEAMGKALSNG